jgi:GWxTD domain-containing protein
MKIYRLLGILVPALTGLLLAQDELPPRQREWLEDVSPIITKAEREIFSRLKTEADRDKFIRFFWRQRDPLPDTAENEFYKEYMDRVRAADQTFGHGSFKRGSQTERGYFYVLLGPPLERSQYTTESQLWPLELWFFKGEVEFGLPPYFYLIFFQPQGSGEFRLYSPGVDGPEKLVVPTMAARTLGRSTAYQIIRQINAELGGAALNYVPGEQTLDSSGIASANVLASVRSLPEKKFSDTYARNYLSYKDYVETEYSDNFIDSSFTAKIFRDGGQAFIHWTVEPRRINFAARGDRYQASFELVLRLERPDGGLVLEKTEEIPLTVTPEQYKAHERQVFAFQDILPVIPGRFRLLGLLKNKTARDFTSFNAMITVPAASSDLRPSDLLLYHSRETMTGQSGRGLRPFSFGGYHYLVSARGEFPSGAEPGAFLQLHGLKTKNLSPQTPFKLEVRAADSETVALTRSGVLTEALAPDGESLDTGPFGLSGLKAGYYSAELSLADEKGGKIVSAKGNFVLLSQAFPVVPWVYARVHPPFPSAEHLSILASEHFLSGQYDRALDLAERAVRLKDDPPSRILQSKALFALNRIREALAVALPVYEATKSREAGKVAAAAHAALKDWPAALAVLEALLKDATEVSVLNLAGECHLNLNRPERALPLFEKSLQLAPDQPEIQALVEKARKLIARSLSKKLDEIQIFGRI